MQSKFTCTDQIYFLKFIKALIVVVAGVLPVKNLYRVWYMLQNTSTTRRHYFCEVFCYFDLLNKYFHFISKETLYTNYNIQATESTVLFIYFIKQYVTLLSSFICGSHLYCLFFFIFVCYKLLSPDFVLTMSVLNVFSQLLSFLS